MPPASDEARVTQPETFAVVNSRLDMIHELEAIQRASFPTLAEDEIITAAHYAAQSHLRNAQRFGCFSGHYSASLIRPNASGT